MNLNFRPESLRGHDHISLVSPVEPLELRAVDTVDTTEICYRTSSFTRKFYQNTNNCQVPCFAFYSVCVHTQSAASPYDAGTSWTTSDVSYWWNIRAASILRSDVPACVIPAAHCDVTNREDLGWPFLDTIIRNTCVVILAFNQHVNIPHLWRG